MSAAANQALWRIELFGGLRAVSGERTITRFRTQKTASVLAYLALHRERPQSREVLRELIWPDEPFEASSNALRVALNSLRKQLEPPGTPHGGVLLADRNNIQLSSAACETDVAEFTERLRSARQLVSANAEPATIDDALRSAVALYQGDLLPGFFGDWAIGERERLSQACLGALLDLTRRLTDAGDFAGASEYAGRAVQIASLNEEAYRGLMRAEAMGGDAAGAHRHFERLTRLLRAEVDTAPSAETRALAAQVDEIAARATAPKGNLSSVIAASPAPQGVSAVSLPPTAVSAPGEMPPVAASLPFPFTRFFGREAERDRLCAMLVPPPTAADAPGALPADRQVTLMGAGGHGKTRLAVEVARALASGYGQSVYYVPLGDEMDARRIGELIAGVLHLPRNPTGDYGDAIVAALNRRPTLLILDNFEQLAPSGGPLVPSLLKSVPTLRLLVTSRRRLEIPGERVVALTALPTPPVGAPPETLAGYPSVALFLDRAQTTLPDFALTPRTADDLAAVCRALEGIPLAIELAAARIRALSLAQMREQIAGERSSDASSGRFPLLAGRRADDPDRHHSLWATIDWSYSLLPPPLRRFFRNLAAFRGGWTLEAAQAVCDEPYALEYLTQLRAHSLIVAEESFPALRFGLLDSLREFADEQTDADERAVYEARHLACFTRIAEASQEGLRGATQRVWLDRLDADGANLRVALARCLSRADFDAASNEAGMHLAGSLFQYWMLRGSLRESAETVVALLARQPSHHNDAPPPATNARAVASNTAGALFLRMGDYEQSRRYLDESFALYRVTGDQPGLARVRSNQGILYGRLGDLEAGRMAQNESLAIRLAIGDRWGAAACYLNLGAAAHNGGDLAAAATAYEESLRLSRAIDDARGTGAALLNLANLAVASGDNRQALERYAECLAVARRQDIPESTALVLFNLGGLLLDTGDSVAAETHLAEALALCRKVGDGPLAGAALVELARAATRRGEFALAQTRLAESLTLPLTRAVTCTALEAACQLANAQNQWERATLLCATTQALRDQFHLPRQANLVATQEALMGDLREKLGAETFEARWREGARLSLEEAKGVGG